MSSLSRSLAQLPILLYKHLQWLSGGEEDGRGGLEICAAAELTSLGRSQSMRTAVGYVST